jgi:hypothetical protein
MVLLLLQEHRLQLLRHLFHPCCARAAGVVELLLN